MLVELILGCYLCISDDRKTIFRGEVRSTMNEMVRTYWKRICVIMWKVDEFLFLVDVFVSIKCVVYKILRGNKRKTKEEFNYCFHLRSSIGEYVARK